MEKLYSCATGSSIEPFVKSRLIDGYFSSESEKRNQPKYFRSFVSRLSFLRDSKEQCSFFVDDVNYLH